MARSKAQEAVESRIEEIKAAQNDVERGTVLSSPANMAGGIPTIQPSDIQNVISAALLLTQSAVTALEAAGRDLFPQAKTLYFDTDLVGVPFMIVSEPREEMRPDKFGRGPDAQKPVYCFQAWLLEAQYITYEHFDEQGNPVVTGYRGEVPKPVDVEIAGAYVRTTLAQLPATVLAARVWMLAYNDRVRTVQDQPARMLSYWKPTAEYLSTSPF